MNDEDMTRRPDDPSGQAVAPSIHATGIEAPASANDSSSPLDLLDAVAASALSSKALARYQAYKEVLLAREQDEEAIVSTLTLFIWDLSESR